jgi:hypothetical protein
LRSNIKNPDSKRIRCLKHIINLIAKAFLFSKNSNNFEINSRDKKKKADFKIVRKLWRNHETYGKFHNIVHFIRITPQKRDKWANIIKNTVEKKLKISY